MILSFPAPQFGQCSRSSSKAPASTKTNLHSSYVVPKTLLSSHGQSMRPGPTIPASASHRALDPKPKRTLAMRAKTALETVVGAAAHVLPMLRNSWIQFRYHRIPILDWTGIDPLSNMEPVTLKLPLAPPLAPQHLETETLYVTTCHPQFPLHRRCRSGFIRRWLLRKPSLHEYENCDVLLSVKTSYGEEMVGNERLLLNHDIASHVSPKTRYALLTKSNETTKVLP